MLSIRTIALAASLAGVFGAPALAQSAPAATTTPTATPTPDVGMKAAPVVKTHHVVHRHVHAAARTVAPTKK